MYKRARTSNAIPGSAPRRNPMPSCLFRQQLSRRFFLIAVLSSIAMLYEFMDPALTSYGGSFDSPVLGINLPAPVLLAEAVSKFSTPWLLGGIAASCGIIEGVGSRYYSLCSTKGAPPRRLAATVVLQAVPLSIIYTATSVIPCVLMSFIACHASLSPEGIKDLQSAGVVVASESPWLAYSGFIAALFLKTMMIFLVVRAGILCMLKGAYAAALPPIAWFLMKFTPIGTAVSATGSFTPDCLVAFSPMSIIQFDAVGTFFITFTAACALIAIPFCLAAIARPNSIVSPSRRPVASRHWR